jgi:hypothetical protein
LKLSRLQSNPARSMLKQRELQGLPRFDEYIA